MKRYYETVTRTITNGQRDLATEIDNALSGEWQAETAREAIEKSAANAGTTGTETWFDENNLMIERKNEGKFYQTYFEATENN